MTNRNTVLVIDLGLRSYKSTWDFQEKVLNEHITQKLQFRKTGKSKRVDDTLFFVEHPPVYTIGKNGDLNNLLVSNEALINDNIEFYKTTRGGDITYHGLGQVVGYPILDLERFFTDLHKYLRYLEEVVILTLSDFGLKGERSSGNTGVWLKVGTSFERKICAMGIKISRWVTMHGFALNVNTDLSYFEKIIPCGIKSKRVTSLRKELNVEGVDTQLVKKSISRHFGEVFEVEMRS